MNNQFKYIFTDKKNTHDDIIELVNSALKEKDVVFKFKKINENQFTLDNKKPFRAYQIYKKRGV